MMDENRFSQLVERCLDHEASAEEMAELQGVLREEKGARERFWDAVEWHALFRQWGEQEWGRRAAEAESRVVAMPTAPPVRRVKVGPPGKRRVGRFAFAQWAGGITALAALLVLVIAVRSQMPVATVIKVTGAVGNSDKMELGARLKPGRIRLEKGAVVIAFDRGARVLLEGPADFEIRDDNSGALFAGRLRADVPPPAHGFKVETPQFTAVDLGTEFGCGIGVDGAGELHVFTGKVDLHAGNASLAPVELTENRAMRVDHGRANEIPAQPFAFLSENELARREKWEGGNFSSLWRAASRQLDENPATVLHLDFENSAGAVISNRAQRAPAGSDATVFGGKPTEGRWPAKNAVSFQGSGDRLEVALPGPFESLTLLAWVRVDDLHGGGNPILSGYDSRGNQVNWGFHREGALRFEVPPPKIKAGAYAFHTRQVIDAQNLGAWVFVACVVDGAARTVTQYFNGESLGAKGGFVRGPFQVAAAEIGNNRARRPRGPNDPPSNLDGSIDELAVLSTPLTGDDIARLYRQGKTDPR